MTSRSPYQGVSQIISYNRGFYGATLAAVAVAMGAATYLHGVWRLAIVAGSAVALVWTAASLVVSHYVYDRSPLYSLDWLTLRPGTWANVHAGLDETTESLRVRLPGSVSYVWDIFDPEQMTEPSIEQARQSSDTAPAERVSWRALPIAEEAVDAVFLMFVAHEFRNMEARHEFFREVARVLRPGGSVVMVEHLRDLPNFLAYGPGFLHFQSRRTWNAAFTTARFAVRRERTLTPFVRVFELRKTGDKVA